MLILAIETSTRPGGLALLRDKTVLGESSFEAPYQTVTQLIPALEALLTQNGCCLDDIQAVAVSIGPGSFTGLRIGIATVQGLALGRETRLFAVPSLFALRQAFVSQLGQSSCIVLRHARQGEVYAGFFGPAGEAVRQEGRYSIQAIEAMLAEQRAGDACIAEAESPVVELAEQGPGRVFSTQLAAASVGLSCDELKPLEADSRLAGLQAIYYPNRIE